MPNQNKYRTIPKTENTALGKLHHLLSESSSTCLRAHCCNNATRTPNFRRSGGRSAATTTAAPPQIDTARSARKRERRRRQRLRARQRGFSRTQPRHADQDRSFAGWTRLRHGSHVCGVVGRSAPRERARRGRLGGGPAPADERRVQQRADEQPSRQPRRARGAPRPHRCELGASARTLVRRPRSPQRGCRPAGPIPPRVGCSSASPPARGAIGASRR